MPVRWRIPYAFVKDATGLPQTATLTPHSWRRHHESVAATSPTRSSRYVSVAVKVSVTTAMLVTSASVLAYLMAESGRPAGEWIIVYMLGVLSIALIFT